MKQVLPHLSRFRAFFVLSALFRPPLGALVGGPILLLGDVITELGVLEEVGVAPDAHLVPSRRRLQLGLDHALPRGEREAIKMVRC